MEAAFTSSDYKKRTENMGFGNNTKQHLAKLWLPRRPSPQRKMSTAFYDADDESDHPLPLSTTTTQRLNVSLHNNFDDDGMESKLFIDATFHNPSLSLLEPASPKASWHSLESPSPKEQRKPFFFRKPEDRETLLGSRAAFFFAKPALSSSDSSPRRPNKSTKDAFDVEKDAKLFISTPCL